MIANDGTKGIGGVAVSRPASIRPPGNLLSVPAHVPGPAAQPPAAPPPTAAQTFAQLLQDELLLSRDPHVASRFVELLDQHFEVKPEQVPWTPAPPPGHERAAAKPAAADRNWKPDPPKLHTGPETWLPGKAYVRPALPEKR